MNIKKSILFFGRIIFLFIYMNPLCVPGSRTECVTQVYYYICDWRERFKPGMASDVRVYWLTRCHMSTLRPQLHWHSWHVTTFGEVFIIGTTSPVKHSVTSCNFWESPTSPKKIKDKKKKDKEKKEKKEGLFQRFVVQLFLGTGKQVSEGNTQCLFHSSEIESTTIVFQVWNIDKMYFIVTEIPLQRNGMRYTCCKCHFCI